MKTFQFFTVRFSKSLAVAGMVGISLWLAPCLSLGGELKITLPPETATLKPGIGADLATANCLVCHSVDYLATQPPMPRKFWDAEVKKMREKYFAPISDEAMEKLAEYLTAAYGK